MFLLICFVGQNTIVATVQVWYLLHVSVESEWDENKAKLNVKKHGGLSFAEAAEVFDDPFAFEIFDERNSDLYESRYLVVGRIKRQVVVTLVYTPRGKMRRIISARYANKKERGEYY